MTHGVFARPQRHGDPFASAPATWWSASDTSAIQAERGGDPHRTLSIPRAPRGGRRRLLAVGNGLSLHARRGADGRWRRVIVTQHYPVLSGSTEQVTRRPHPPRCPELVSLDPAIGRSRDSAGSARSPGGRRGRALWPAWSTGWRRAAPQEGAPRPRVGPSNGYPPFGFDGGPGCRR